MHGTSSLRKEISLCRIKENLWIGFEIENVAMF